MGASRCALGVQALFLAPVPEAGRQRVQHFSAKLDLVMKLANISRGRLAASVGVDKSVVSRWLGDAARPSGHNLSLVTELVRRDLPGVFSLLTWELELADFASAIGAHPQGPEAVADPPAGPPATLPLATLAVSRSAVPREGWVYPGLYRGYRKAFANTGVTVAQGLMLRVEGDRLAARCSDGLFNYRGEALLLRGQLFVLVEETTRLDKILSVVLNGVSAPMARILDGLVMGVSGDRACTPSATAILFERVADTTGDDAADQALWDDCVDELIRVNAERAARERMPPEFALVVDNQVGVRREDGEVDHVLRVPYARSLATATSAANLQP
jgi:hypothetical protein